MVEMRETAHILAHLTRGASSSSTRSAVGPAPSTASRSRGRSSSTCTKRRAPAHAVRHALPRAHQPHWRARARAEPVVAVAEWKARSSFSARSSPAPPTQLRARGGAAGRVPAPWWRGRARFSPVSRAALALPPVPRILPGAALPVRRARRTAAAGAGRPRARAPDSARGAHHPRAFRRGGPQLPLTRVAGFPGPYRS